MPKSIGRKKDEVRVLNMPSFIDANNVQPFIDNELKGVLNQVDYYEKNGKTLTSGYNALILPMLCKVYLDAREAKVLKPQHIINQTLYRDIILNYYFFN